jgi:2-keto-4-pentenoate hydratase
MTSELQPIPAELAGINALPAARLTPQLQQQAAAMLAQRRLTGVAGPLTDDRLRPQSVADAFSVQQQVARLIAQPIAGWKCLLPSADKIVVAPIYHGSVCQLDKQLTEGSQNHKMLKETLQCQMWPSTVPASAGLARVEPELAFVLVKDLPPRQTLYTEAEVDAAIGATHLALELIQSRFLTDSGAGFFDQLADGLFNQGLFLGPEILPTADFNGSEFQLQLTFADGRTQNFVAVHPNQQPRAGLYWLVNFLSANGIPLQAGQAVITGSYAGVLDLPFNENIQFQYGDWGQFMVKFVIKTS